MIKAARRPGTDPSEGAVGQGGLEHLPAHFRAFCPVDSWKPAVNFYRLPQRLDVCVDLAGVEPGSITVRVEVSRLVIQGVRAAPQPRTDSNEVMCIVAMEIDHGPFCRTIPLAQRVDQAGVRIRYTKGLLWVRLPLSQVE